MRSSNVKMIVTCHMCEKEQPPFDVSGDQLRAWRNGGHAQTVFPHLTADQRELLISGTCNDCFQDMFGEDTDDD